MRLDQIVTRRFAELHAKGEAVLSGKKRDFTASHGGDQYYKVPSGAYKEWVFAPIEY